MPQTRRIATEQPLTVLPPAEARFSIPENHHLLITTSHSISAWDSAGVHSIFTSSRGGIIAAKEAQDGSGVLAVADSHVVVLHDAKRQQEKSWGLEADDDAVRHLEYTADGKSLFLSTHLTSDIQRYSIECSRLLSPTHVHASPPTVLAVSSNGHLMVSAADSPPVVYLKSLQHNNPPMLIASRASTTAVSVAAFHPERPNIFLLGFRDGTVAAFDATRIGRHHGGSMANQQHVNAGEIGHLSKLHRRMSEASRVASITDAAFLPGYKTRAVTVGHDGKCRLIEFADGGSILRTWHAKAPVTSVSVLSVQGTAQGRQPSAGKAPSHMIGGPTSTNNLIAIGRADGRVHIYDSVGLLLCQKDIGVGGQRIINVEWVNGPSPRPITMAEHQDVSSAVQKGVEQQQHPATSKKDGKAPTSGRKETFFDHVGLPPELRRPKESKKTAIAGTPREFTVHPDEIEEDTVRHTPIPSSSRPVGVPKGDYLDLFSPVKPVEARQESATNKRVASPPQSRPRISSKTFVKSPEATPGAPQTAVANSRNLPLYPSTDSGSPTQTLPTDGSAGLEKGSSFVQDSAVAFKSTSRRRSRKSIGLTARRPAANNNAKVLADLRKMSTAQAGGTLSSYAAPKVSQRHSLKMNDDDTVYSLNRASKHVQMYLDSVRARETHGHEHEKHAWPIDSNQDSSLDGDIWLTSGSDEDEDNTMRSRNRRRRLVNRPPARQTSRARVDTNGTMSTVVQHLVPAVTGSAMHRQRFDGSTEDEEMFTAESNFSPTGTFSPSSNDVRELFPRTSSLSPKKRRSEKAKAFRSAHVPDNTLREIAPNTVNGRQVRSPWQRIQAHKNDMKPAVQPSPTKQRTNKPVQIYEDENQKVTSQVAQPHCEICVPTQAKVNDLESQLSRLKAEVVVLKTVLRRNGLPLPPSLRQR